MFRLKQSLNAYLEQYDIKDNVKTEGYFYEILISICVVNLNVANVFAQKVVSIFGFNIALSGLLFPFTFLFLIIINEVYGHQKCGRSVIAMLIGQFAFLLIIWQLSKVSSPTLTYSSEVISGSLKNAFQNYGQVILGSMSAVGISYYFFSVVNSKLKVVLCQYNIFIRFFISVGLAKIILVIVAYTINLWGVVTIKQLISICLITWVVKMIIAGFIIVISIPLVVLIKKYEYIDTYDIGISYNPISLFSKKSEGKNLYNTINSEE